MSCELYAVEWIENHAARRHGITLRHYIIRQPDGMLMRSMDGVVWSHKSRVTAHQVATEANQYLAAKQGE